MGKAIGAVATGGLSLLAPKLGLGLEDEQGAYATPEQKQQGIYKKFANDFSGEMGAAEKSIQDSPLTRGLYGEGGLQSRLDTEEKQLASQGFKLTPEDMTAYGQTSGDISRLFGQQENDVSASLARRGLGAGDSGAAGAAFSGIAGNKNEMLAKAQTDIAQKRMADSQKRLEQTRSNLQTLGIQGSELANNRYNAKGQSLLNAVNVENAGNDQNRTALADQQAAVKPGLFSTIGQGLQAGIGNLATQAPGMLATGGMPVSGGAGGSSALGSKSNTFSTTPNTSLFGNNGKRYA